MSTASINDPEKRVNVAVVGLGFMGVTHLRAYLANPMARVVAVCDAVRVPVNGVLQGVSGNITKSDDIDLGPDVRVYRKVEELLADADVELVDLCTPTPLHAPQVIAALKAGKHVICEKPLARTSEFRSSLAGASVFQFRTTKHRLTMGRSADAAIRNDGATPVAPVRMAPEPTG